MMKSKLFIIFLLLKVSFSANASQRLFWEDLLPKLEMQASSIQSLTDQQLILYEVVKQYQLVQAHPDIHPNKNHQESQKRNRQKLIQQGIDVDYLLALDAAKRHLSWQLKNQANISLKNQTVRIPGFVVPITIEAGRITQLYLVPSLGPLITLAPPQANQLIKINYPSGLSLTNKNQPVWVSGTLLLNNVTDTVKIAKRELPVTAAYQMNASFIFEMDNFNNFDVHASKEEY